MTWRLPTGQTGADWPPPGQAGGSVGRRDKHSNYGTSWSLGKSKLCAEECTIHHKNEFSLAVCGALGWRLTLYLSEKEVLRM